MASGRAPLVAIVMVSLLFAVLPPGTQATVTPVAAHGIVEYSIVKQGIPPTCSGSGPFTVAYDSATRRLTIAGTATECTPIWSSFTGCDLRDDGTVRCHRDENGHRINITLTPAGHFDYVWAAPDFHEVIRGQMARVV